MKFYFDDIENLNLHKIPQIKNIRPMAQLKQFYEVGEAEFVESTKYKEQGIYFIEVSKLTHQWTGGPFGESFKLISSIPSHVINAVKNNKLRIVIVSIVEGDPFVKENWDAFRALTDAVKTLELPPFSVLVVSGNVLVDKEYQDWLQNNNETAYIEFIGGSEGPWSLPPLRENISNQKARDKDTPYYYSSLNRAHRPHRTEHLFVLANKGLLNNALVSGGAFFEQNGIGSPKWLDTPEENWKKQLLENYPKSADLSANDLKENNPANDINLDIYDNAILSVVSETFFEETGLFVTEKTWRPISVGSPQIVLGQPHLIQYLKEKFGINLNFLGLNLSYDAETDNRQRFRQFHQTLIDWCKLKIDMKRRLSIMWDAQLRENQKILFSTNFRQVVIDDIIASTKKYFLDKIN